MSPTFLTFNEAKFDRMKKVDIPFARRKYQLTNYYGTLSNSVDGP
ncbi:hypothetical protein LAC1533_1488 [Ligilactobacillus acidipiscis]|uniref:Uncharacterized protein n=1 Tax=Ligilactobacillus acidipiscis TaxID=89059 RepID=A0A1K1KPX4_9LACO|nr:hypothetical protein LAC1533_1488 [Ligilactobacillus acidipiscis]